MASIKILLRDQEKKDHTYPILIRIIQDRKTKYISIGYSVRKDQFREGLENWVTKHPDSILINAAIESKRSSIAEKFYLADIAGEKPVFKKKGTFFNAIRQRMTALELNNQVPMFNRLKAKLTILKENSKDIPLNEISKKYVLDYVNDRRSAGMKISTIKKDLSDFSNVLNSCDFEGKDWFKVTQKSLKSEPVNREKLTLQEIQAIEKVTLFGINDVARDMFLFAYYTHGMRFQNVAMFEKSMIKNGTIRYQMNKGKKFREIEVHPKLQRIIDKYDAKPYLFPVVQERIKDNWQKKLLIDNANALINLRLKRVAVIAGIEKNLSTHTSRHSFAYNCLTEGLPIEIIKDALGHSSYSVTQVYLKALSDEKINSAVRKLYD